jgi:tetratricopeptide (TPR) repeat protein/DNA-binding CsgD family transcriptional regulator
MRYRYIVFVILPFLLWYCQSPLQKEMKEKLVLIDSLIATDAGAADDSLSMINIGDLDQENRAYYFLLNSIVGSKLNHEFFNDSAISASVELFRKPIPDRDFVRALIFQGIVRYRVDNIPDSLVFVSFKEVESLVNSNPDIVYRQDLVKLWFYLGLLHKQNQNFQLADEYLNLALRKAKEDGDVETVVVTSLVVFWRNLRSGQRDKALEVLDDLDDLEGITAERQFDITNARAAYYMLSGNYNSALDGYMELESLASEMKEKPRLSNVYYSICNAYKGMGEKDSALIFAQKAVEHFTDSLSEYQDYYLFTNLADIAADQDKNDLAVRHSKNAVDFLLKKIDERSEKRILELEKQYDLSQARVETLKQKQKFQRFVFLASSVLVLLLFVFLIYFLNLKRSRIELENERLMRIAAEKEVAGKMRESHQRRHLLRFYQLITQREMVAQQRFDMLSQKYVKSDPSAHNELQTELGALKEEFSGMMYDLMNDDLFYANIDVPQSFTLTNTEKVILFLLNYEIPSSEIATVLGISANNLRVRKSNLKKRIVENLSDYPSIDDLLSLF